MRTVFVAGATGYLGRFLCAEYQRRGWHVRALVREASQGEGLAANACVQAQATMPETLRGKLEGVDPVISALGITRQADGLQYRDVDYQANLNLLVEAQRAGVKRFAYIHVLNANRMTTVPLVMAKTAFVRALQVASISSTIIAPSGYFSDMADFLEMARRGRIWLFGAGDHRINPIHGADLAVATADAIAHERAWIDVGGPETFSHVELGEAAFAALGRQPKISHLPDCLRKLALAVVPRLAPRRIGGPVQFFLSAMGMNMTGEPHGTRRLIDHLEQLCAGPHQTPQARPMIGEVSDDA